jgi:hypothetical protein
MTAHHCAVKHGLCASAERTVPISAVAKGRCLELSIAQLVNPALWEGISGWHCVAAVQLALRNLLHAQAQPGILSAWHALCLACAWHALWHALWQHVPVRHEDGTACSTGILRVKWHIARYAGNSA